MGMSKVRTPQLRPAPAHGHCHPAPPPPGTATLPYLPVGTATTYLLPLDVATPPCVPHGQTPEEALCTHWGRVPERCEAREHTQLLN